MSVQRGDLVKVIEIARRYGVTRLILFGSNLHESSQARDLDLACDGVPGWKLYALGAEIEETLSA
jgi:uncharacterized protein